MITQELDQPRKWSDECSDRARRPGRSYDHKRPNGESQDGLDDQGESGEGCGGEGLVLNSLGLKITLLAANEAMGGQVMKLDGQGMVTKDGHDQSVANKVVNHSKGQRESSCGIRRKSIQDRALGQAMSGWIVTTRTWPRSMYRGKKTFGQFRVAVHAVLGRVSWRPAPVSPYSRKALIPLPHAYILHSCGYLLWAGLGLGWTIARVLGSGRHSSVPSHPYRSEYEMLIRVCEYPRMIKLEYNIYGSMDAREKYDRFEWYVCHRRQHIQRSDLCTRSLSGPHMDHMVNVHAPAGKEKEGQCTKWSQMHLTFFCD